MSVIEAVARMQQIESQLTQLFNPGKTSGVLGAAASGAASGSTTTTGTGVSGSADLFAQALAATGATSATSDVTVSNPAGVTGADVINSAKKYLGVPYVFGGTDSSGMDCSGLVQTVFSDLGVDVPRLVSRQMTVGTEIPSLAQAKPGDLIVLDGGDHIVIYAGNNQIIHAPYEGKNVVLRDAYFDESDITTIRRIVPADAAGVAAAGSVQDLATAARAALMRAGVS